MTDDTSLNTQLAALLAKCAQSDEDALTELYHLTAANLFAVQVRILGMNPMAERALHDTYTRVWLKSSDYSDALGEPLVWLTSIARNHALNLRRARRNEDIAEAELDETAELLPDFVDTQFLGKHPDSQSLLTKLNRLDTQTCDAIIRSYLDGWSLQELSIAYDQPVARIHSSLHKGMLSLRGQG